MLKPAPPRTIGAPQALLHNAMTSFSGESKNRGFTIAWSSIFRTDKPITSGSDLAIALLIADFQSAIESKSRKHTSNPAFAVAAATHANPRGSGVMAPESSRLPDMSKTRIVLRLSISERIVLQACNLLRTAAHARDTTAVI
jgi:hypothetical protein